MFKVDKINILNNGNTKAIADIVINDSFVVKGFIIMSGSKGLFVKSQSKQDKNGVYSDTAYPITAAARKELEDVLLTEYNKRTVK